MWGAGEGAAAGGGGGDDSAAGASSGAQPAEDAALAHEKALLHRAELQAAAAAAQSLFGDTSAGAVGGSSAPLAGAVISGSFSYRQPAAALGFSSSSSSATATPLYSPEDWPRHLAPLSTHFPVLSTPPSASSASSPTGSAQSLADFHFSTAGRGGGGGSRGSAGSEAGQWQPHLSTFAPSLPASSSGSSSFALSSVAPRAALPASSQSSPYSASPSLLSPSSASASRDEDVWALEVAKINRQAVMQHFSAAQQQLRQTSDMGSSGDFSLPAAVLSTSSPSMFPASLPAIPLGPPLARPSSAQSKLLSLLSRSEDEALKRQQQQYLQPRHYPHTHQQPQQQLTGQSVFPYSEVAPSQHFQQRRQSDRHSPYGTGGDSAPQPAHMSFAAPRHTSPSPVLFDAPPPLQSRSSSTPQTGRSLQPVGAATPSSESAALAFVKKPVTARSPSPRSVSAQQPFQPRESFSSLAASQPFAYSSQLVDQRPHRFSPSDPLALQPPLARPLEFRASLHETHSAPLSPSSAEVAAAASAYLRSDTSPSSIATFLTRPQQQLLLQLLQQQHSTAVQQTGYPLHGLSQVQSVTVQHVMADPTEQRQQRDQPPLSPSARPSPVGLPHSARRSSPHSPVPKDLLQPSSHPAQPSLSPHPSSIPTSSHASVFPAPLASAASPAASSLSSMSHLVTLQLLAAAGIFPPSQAQNAYEDENRGSVADPSLVSHYAAVHYQQQQLFQQPNVPSAELPFYPPSSQAWPSASPFHPPATSSELAALRHRSFITVGAASDAEARVKAEEDDAEMERLMVQQAQQQLRMHQQEEQQPPAGSQVQLTAQAESGSYAAYRPLGGFGATESQQQQQEQRYYVPAPSPALGLPSDLPSFAPIFSSSLPDVPRFSASAAANEPNQRTSSEQANVDYTRRLSDIAQQQSFQSSEPSSAIPTFSSYLPSESERPLSLSLHNTPLPPPSTTASSTKRRAVDASTAPLWACPFNCNKVYRTTSSRSIARHLQNCPNKPLYESFMAAGRAAGLETGFGVSKRKQKKRRKNSELLEHERWNCPNHCGTFFRSTSTKSIHRHKRLCRFGLSESSAGAGQDDPPEPDDDDESDDEQRGDDDDEAEQGDDDADDEEADEADKDEKRGEAMHAKHTTRGMQAAHQQGGGVEEVAGQLLALSLSSELPPARYATPASQRRPYRLAGGSSPPSNAEKERDEKNAEHSQLQPPEAASRSSSTPPLLFIAAATTGAHPDLLHGPPYRRHSFDSSSTHLADEQQRVGVHEQQQRNDDHLYSPSGNVSNRKDSQSGTDSGGSGSKDSQLSSESSTSSSSSSSSAASSSSSSAASSSPASASHTPPRTSPIDAHRSLATTAQRSGQAVRRGRRRVSSHDVSLPAASSSDSTAAQQHKGPSASSASSSSPHSPASSSLAASPDLALPSGATLGDTLQELRTTGGKSRSARQLQLDKAPAEAAAAHPTETHAVERKERY